MSSNSNLSLSPREETGGSERCTGNVSRTELSINKSLPLLNTSSGGLMQERWPNEKTAGLGINDGEIGTDKFTRPVTAAAQTMPCVE